MRLAYRALAASLLSIACHTGYQQVNGEWSYVTWNEGNGTQSHELGADTATFRVVKAGAYAKDKNHVYYKWNAMQDADPVTFQTLSEPGYTKDKNRVYYESLAIKDADPASFRLLAEPGYTRDRTHVFIMGNPIRGVDPSTFVVLRAPFGRDASRVYSGTVPMPLADRAHFEPLQCDRNWSIYTSKPEFLFLYGDAFADLDISPENAVVTGQGWQWGRDGRFYYYGPARVEGADYASFKILSPFESVDAKRVYAFSFPQNELPARRKRRDAGWL